MASSCLFKAGQRSIRYLDHICLSIHRWACGLFPPSDCRESCCCEHERAVFDHPLLASWGLSLGVESLARVMIVQLFDKLPPFFIAPTPFYVPISNSQGFQFPHLLTNIYCFSFFMTAILVGMNQYLILVRLTFAC